VYTEPDVPPPRVRPPLTKRMRLRHWVVLDCVVAVPAALVMVLTIRSNIEDSGAVDAYGLASFAFGVPFALAGAVAVGLRRLHPLTALGTLLALSVVVSAFGYRGFLVFASPAAYVLYIVAATRSRRTSGIALACTVIVLYAEALIGFAHQVGGAGPVVPLSLVVVVFWAFGFMVRQRRLYATGLQHQAASRAVAEERLRIARELHDVVAHSMSVIAVQAGFGQYVIDEQPGKAREALGAIQATSRDALDEMRRMLSVLRQADGQDGLAGPAGPAGPPRLRLRDLAADPADRTDQAGSTLADGGNGPSASAGAPLRPAPGLADLDRLVTRVGHAGVHVELRVTGDRGNVPAGIDLSAFRIIQEALTNVVKHAATPECRVTVDYREDELSLEILDEGKGGGGTPAADGTSRAGTSGGASGVSGHGLIGMRERVHLCGGQFTAGPLPERGFRVAAVLPLAAAETGGPG
jgi:signal transduction histidine kinase